MTKRLEPYRVEAFNTAKASENKMHDDRVAQKFGFSGGLVPGVDVLAYMIHPAVEAWGREFLSRGLIEARFTKPVYDGETVLVTAEPDGEGLAVQVEGGDVRATGTASLTARLPAFALADFPETDPVAVRAPVDAHSYEVAKLLGSAPRCWPQDAAAEYLEEVREADPIYQREGVTHPGVLQRIMNKVLVDNAILGPWIHVGSRMQLLAPAMLDDELVARARVTANYEKKGHRFVELDALIVANGTTPVAHCQHVAIYQPREQVAKQEA
jgi:acyl dehydratase